MWGIRAQQKLYTISRCFKGISDRSEQNAFIHIPGIASEIRSCGCVLFGCFVYSDLCRNFGGRK